MQGKRCATGPDAGVHGTGYFERPAVEMRSSCRFPDTCPELNKAFQAISSPMPLKTQQTVDWQAACILQSGPGARAYKGNAGDGRRSRAEHVVVLQRVGNAA